MEVNDRAVNDGVIPKHLVHAIETSIGFANRDRFIFIVNNTLNAKHEWYSASVDVLIVSDGLLARFEVSVIDCSGSRFLFSVVLWLLHFTGVKLLVVWCCHWSWLLNLITENVSLNDIFVATINGSESAGSINSEDCFKRTDVSTILINRWLIILHFIRLKEVLEIIVECN